MAKWTTAYKNRLPDSAFLYVAPGGRKDASGRTVPRSLRHLPIYDLTGRLSLSHVRSVLGSYGQRAKIPRDAKVEARALAHQLLAHHSKSQRAFPASGRLLPACLHCGKIIIGPAATVHAKGKAPAPYHLKHVKHHGKRATFNRRAA